jgi:hypothetical protein
MDMTLKEFLLSKTVRNAWLCVPGFHGFYARKGVVGYTYQGEKYQTYPVLVIANVTAKHPGTGAFTRLLKHLNYDYPDLTIYIESVMNKRFKRYLIEAGFTIVNDDCAISRISNTESGPLYPVIGARHV